MMPERIVISFYEMKTDSAQRNENVFLTVYIPSSSMTGAVRTAKKQLSEYGDFHGVWVTKEKLSDSGKDDVWEKDGSTRHFQMIDGKILELSKL